MEWSEILFKTIALVITVLGGVFTYYVLPILKNKAQQIENTLTESQKESIKYWIKVFVQYAEEKYTKENQGITKKEFVIKLIKEKGFNVLSDQEFSALIDLTVKEFNIDGWDKVKI